jgi:hypothetical protein
MSAQQSAFAIVEPLTQGFSILCSNHLNYLNMYSFGRRAIPFLKENIGFCNNFVGFTPVC